MSGYGGYDPNPYQPPSYPTQQGPWGPAQGPSSVSPAIVDSLRKTRPWVMLIAVLGSIWTGLMLLGGLGIMVAANGMEAGMGFGYLIAAGIYVVPLVMMYRYSNAISRLLQGGGQQELEQAIDAQRGFWQTMGILTLIGIVLVILMIFVAAAVVSSLDNGAFRF
ncbi:hypothetical protein ACNOYE_17835 [Nannocystaceae bacterium ST9]